MKAHRGAERSSHVNSLTADEARRSLSKTLDRVARRGSRVTVTRRGKPVAAIISAKDLELFERLLEVTEDRADVEAALAAEREARGRGEKPIPWREVKARAGLR